MLLGRPKANRYKVGKDAEDMGAVTVNAQPSVCLVFRKTDAKGKKRADDLKRREAEKERWVGIIRAVGLQVTVSSSNEDTKWFLLISAPEPVLRFEGEQMKLKLRAKKIHGGGLYVFQRRLIDLYDKSSEGELFSSLHQMMIIKHILEAKRHEGGAEMDFDRLVGEDAPIEAMFFMHYEGTRKQLIHHWARFGAWNKAQPLELIREYFGEKIALYFCWIGFYTTMLWIPALVGAMVMASQLYTSLYTDSLDNPWVPLYCIFTALWAIFYLEGWKRLENQKKFEWDTEEFEDLEDERPEFKKTEKRINKISGEEEMYYPTWRRRLQIGLSCVIVAFFITMVVLVVCEIMVIKVNLSKYYGMLGTAVGGILNAGSIMAFNMIYDKVVGPLTDWENWRTETEYDDAKIAKDFVFKFVNAYFALFFVAFIQNYVPIYGVDMHCPDYHCMPVLTSTLFLVFGTQMFVQQSMEIATPMVKAWRKRVAIEERMQKEGKAPNPLSPEEDQANLEDYEGVFDDYNEMVVQFGYVSLFAAAFPLTATLALINNVLEIRVDAIKVLCSSRRAQYQCAADIGTWMAILEIIATVGIMTNMCLVGFTSHGLLFYFPDLDIIDKVWIVIIAEHTLLFIKIVGQALIPDVSEEAIEDHEVTKHKLEVALGEIKSRNEKEDAEREMMEEDESEED